MVLENIVTRIENLDVLDKYLRKGCKTGGMDYRSMNIIRDKLIELIPENHEDPEIIKKFLSLIDDANIRREDYLRSINETQEQIIQDQQTFKNVYLLKNYFDRLISNGHMEKDMLEGYLVHMGADPVAIELLRIYGNDVHVVDNDPEKIDKVLEDNLLPETHVHEELIEDFLEDRGKECKSAVFLKGSQMKEDVFPAFSEAADHFLTDGSSIISSYKGNPIGIMKSLEESGRGNIIRLRGDNMTTYVAMKKD